MQNRNDIIIEAQEQLKKIIKALKIALEGDEAAANFVIKPLEVLTSVAHEHEVSGFEFINLDRLYDVYRHSNEDLELEDIDISERIKALEILGIKDY
jgi:hypothetical protein